MVDKFPGSIDFLYDSVQQITRFTGLSVADTACDHDQQKDRFMVPKEIVYMISATSYEVSA